MLLLLFFFLYYHYKNNYYKSGCFVEGSVSQIVGKANEDGYSVFLGGNQPELKGNFRENFSMIGVFDGHGGVYYYY